MTTDQRRETATALRDLTHDLDVQMDIIAFDLNAPRSLERSTRNRVAETAALAERLASGLRALLGKMP